VKSYLIESCSICSVDCHKKCLINIKIDDKNAPMFCPSCLLKAERVEDFNSMFFCGGPIQQSTFVELQLKYRNLMDNIIINSKPGERIHCLDYVSNYYWSKNILEQGILI
jgi:hypothetical protein